MSDQDDQTTPDAPGTDVSTGDVGGDVNVGQDAGREPSPALPQQDDAPDAGDAPEGDA